MTYHIINRLEKEGGFQNENFRINALFYADDGLLMTTTENEMNRMIDALVSLGNDTGLKINKDKSSVIIFNKKEQPEQIRNIRVTKEIKYLGITITNTRNCFKIHKENCIQKAKKLANLTYPVIAQSCNKILIGKTFWKSIALPTILYASSIMAFTKEEIQNLQRIENSVYSAILGAPCYAQVPALRGDIGSSAMETRIRQNQLNYLKYVEDHERNELVKRIVVEKALMKKDYWIKSTKEFMKEINVKYCELRTIKKENLNNKIKQWDNKKWQKEVAEKSSLSIYKNWKSGVKEESIYDNRPSSEILFKARTNNLKLNDRNRHNYGDTRCLMCEWTYEDLKHFLLWCTGYGEIRKKSRLLQRPYIEDEENIIGHILFNDENLQDTKDTVYEVWKKREAQLKN